MAVLIGTSGWQYRDWRGEFYPERLPKRLWLEHYARHYPTVENNGAFYRLPDRDTFAGWRDRLPDGFVMAVKASRFLTHMKQLREPAEPVDRLSDAVSGLGDRLGPILLQLPPRLKADHKLLAACLDRFRPGQRVAVEFRHESWWTDEVRQVMGERDAAVCWSDRGGRPQNPLWHTASWAYLRLHEGTAKPWPSYGDTALNTWCRRLDERWPGSADCYVYFNNDQGGAAVRNADRFAELMRRLGREVASSDR
ncbi:DUF72 domain-containing protein [Glycomyces buryatensis]|uniref:DUF72 domain-containing protein n=1 Tax=Glycomyces buryatensis TaxID=2570927 RepID=A0A4S8Q2R6_9ACTN|nr:DUF72 domain-containing protein [Glycomyces buryatensis]THV38453.1 DUF72 domain-containing protein [Glycomyces buryatensis]